MDDIRAAAMSAEDWLKLLDAHRASPASARYRNKAAMAPRVIIMTASKEPAELFYFAQGIGGSERAESVDQFLRRLQHYVRVVDPKKYGLYNMVPCQPQKLDCAIKRIVGHSIHGEESVYTNWGMMPVFGDALAPAFVVINSLVRCVDRIAGGDKLANAEGGLNEATIKAMRIYYELYSRAAEVGAMPFIEATFDEMLGWPQTMPVRLRDPAPESYTPPEGGYATRQVLLPPSKTLERVADQRIPYFAPVIEGLPQGAPKPTMELPEAQVVSVETVA